MRGRKNTALLVVLVVALLLALVLTPQDARAEVSVEVEGGGLDVEVVDPEASKGEGDGAEVAEAKDAAAEEEENEAAKAKARRKGKRSTRDWEDIDWNKLEGEWEEGDEEDELLNEFEYQQAIDERLARQETAGLDFNNPEMMNEFLEKQRLTGGGGMGGGMMMGGGGGGTGPQLLFAHLHPPEPEQADADDPEAWSTRDVDLLASRWRQLLLTNGKSAYVYNINQKNQLLLQVQRGRHTADVVQFLIDQAEIHHIVINNNKIPGEARPPAPGELEALEEEANRKKEEKKAQNKRKKEREEKKKNKKKKRKGKKGKKKGKKAADSAGKAAATATEEL